MSGVLHRGVMSDVGPTDARGPGRVVQLLGPSTGGIRAHVGELTRHLRNRGWVVEVLGPAHVMDGAGGQTGVVDLPTNWNPSALARARRQLATRCHGDAVVLHVHGLKAGLVAFTMRSRPPTVLTIHNLVAGTRRGVAARMLQRFEAAIISRADHVIVISDEIGQRLRGMIADDRQTFVLPVSPPRTVTMSPSDVRALHSIAHDAPLVVIVARHHRQKDLVTFLHAMNLVRATIADVRAVMVGDGPERSAIDAERKRLGLDGTVVIAGHRPNPVDEMNTADVVALSSRWEGSPLVIAVCLLLGKPLATTAVGTVSRHLHDGVDARVVGVGDSAALGTAIVELLADPPAAARIGAAGKRVAEYVFDPGHLVDEVTAVYRALLDT